MVHATSNQIRNKKIYDRIARNNLAFSDAAFELHLEANKLIPELTFPNELRPAIENFSDCRDELKSLFEIHYQEISVHKKKGISLKPNYKAYMVYELNGQLLFITLRKDGKIIGYFSGMIVEPLHYECLTLTLDLFYVVPEMRGKRNGNCGQIILDAVKAEAKRRGVRLWTMGRKVHIGKHLEKLLIENGFEPFEVHYALWL